MSDRPLRDARKNATVLRPGESLNVADGQPVTPDREALAGVIAERVRQHTHFGRIVAIESMQSEIVADILPLLTEALDRARQQGRDEAAAAIKAWRNDRFPDFDEVMAIAERLARGGPNRKDGE